MKNNGFRTFLIIALLSLSGCKCITSQTNMQLKPPVTEQDGIVLLSDLVNPQVEFSDRSVDECLGEELRSYLPNLMFVPAEIFREHLFPYFSPSTAPYSAEEYQTLINNPKIRARIAALKVRYLIVQRQANTKNKGHGSIIPFAGPNAAGLLGFVWWNRQTVFDAHIWDLKTGLSQGTAQVQAEWTGIVPVIILPVPIYLPATEKASCKELAKQLAKVLTLR